MPEEDYTLEPPHDLAAEAAALGSMLLSATALAEVSEIVQAKDFYRPANQAIFGAVMDLYGQGEAVDAITVSAALTSRGDLLRVGGAPYLHTLIQGVPSTATAARYARIVAANAVLRRLQQAGVRIAQLANGAADEADDLVAQAQTFLSSVEGKRQSEDLIVLEHLLQPTMDELEAIGSRGTQMTGVPTGYRDLDELTNGLHPGQMIVLAGRPGAGKSTAGLDVARHAAITHRMTTAIFSLEMSRTEIVMRALSAEGKVPLHNMRAGRMTDDDWHRIARRQAQVADAPLWIDDSANLTMPDIRAKARRLKEQQDLRLIVIDYLQLMSGTRSENRQQEVSEISRNLKLLAKELEIPVIAMSQLNRGSEQRTDKKPMLSDLRESGSIEQDSDLVVLLHRPDLSDKEERPGEADFIVAKHRNGPTATITLAFQGHYSRFTDMAY